MSFELTSQSAKQDIAKGEKAGDGQWAIIGDGVKKKCESWRKGRGKETFAATVAATFKMVKKIII